MFSDVEKLKRYLSWGALKKIPTTQLKLSEIIMVLNYRQVCRRRYFIITDGNPAFSSGLTFY
jgi:hypothetical protein